MNSGKAVEVLPDGTQQAPFSYDFALDAKALDHTIDENGDLWIEGYASDFGLDRQEEAFEPGAFQRGLKTFLDRNPIMLYHHQYDKALGQFVDARVDQNGLWVKGRVDAPAPGSWAEDVFNKIRKGTIKAFSVGGLFRRRMTADGPRIYDVDLGEISVTPFPVNPRTTFSVIAKKAFEGVEGVQTPPAPGEPAAPAAGESEPCQECMRREAEAAAKAATEKETDEALLKRLIERERESLEAEQEAAAKKEEAPKSTSEPTTSTDTAELLKRLEALAAKFEQVASKGATEGGEKED